MSNAMSRNKSRWKSAVLAGAALAVISPLAAKAQTTAGTMSLSLSLSPMGNVVNYGTTQGASAETGGSPGTSEYIAPDQNVDIYVYATITQQNNVATTAAATSNIAGFQYAYFNVLQNNGSSGVTYNGTPSGSAINGISSTEGSVIGVIPNETLGFQSSSGAQFLTNGSQAGATGFTSGTYAVGAPGDGVDQINMTSMAKPRSASPIWSSLNANASSGSTPSNYTVGTGDGTNVFVVGNQISFLLETLVYKPSFAVQGPLGTVNGNGVNTLSVTIPNLPSTYAGANYFTGVTNSSTGSETNSNTSVGAAYTHTNYLAAGASVGGYNFSPTVSLYDAADGDALLNGNINSPDYGVINSNYGLVSTAVNGDAGWTNGDFLLNGNVNSPDYGVVNSYYGATYGPLVNSTGPAIIGVSTAQIAGGSGASSVPEPTSLGLLAIGSLVALKRRRSNV